MTARSRTGPLLVLTALAALVAGLLVPASPSADAGVPPWHPSRLTHLQDSQQVVVVTSRRWGSSHAMLRAYQQDDEGTWHLAKGPWAARVGWNGMVRGDRREQGSGTTPAATFRLGLGFGSRPDPGTGLDRYRRFDKNDYWVYDPKDPRTYNVLEPFRSRQAHWRRSWAEHLRDFGGGQYRYAVVVNFNLPSGVHWSDRLRQRVADEPADTRRGGGIFVHVNGRGATAGCVSVSRDRMVALLRWLDSDDEPRIVIGPRRAITRM